MWWAAVEGGAGQVSACPPHTAELEQSRNEANLRGMGPGGVRGKTGTCWAWSIPERAVRWEQAVLAQEPEYGISVAG